MMDTAQHRGLAKRGPRHASDELRLGNYLRHLRERAGLSHDDVAQRTGIDAATLELLEGGIHTHIGEDKVHDLASALNTRPQDLYASMRDHLPAEMLPCFTRYLEIKFNLTPPKALHIAEHFQQFLKEVDLLTAAMESVNEHTPEEDSHLAAKARLHSALRAAEKTRKPRRKTGTSS